MYRRSVRPFRQFSGSQRVYTGRMTQTNNTVVLSNNGAAAVGARSVWSRVYAGTTPVPAYNTWIVAGVIVGGTALSLYNVSAETKQPNWDQIRKEIAALLEPKDHDYDDGSYGPLFVRLAWHASGTYEKHGNKYGSNGATMRFKPESEDGANNGLALARAILKPIKDAHPEISYADLWTLAGIVAIEEMGGPKVPWRSGRKDATDAKNAPRPGNLPDAAQGQDHVRSVFYRMGFNDREIVALVGAHAVGRCHGDRSGYVGPWTRAPTTFSNEFFRELIENTWTKKKWNGPEQYEDPTGELMMLPADLALIKDPAFKKYVELYAKDEQVWFADFAAAFSKLLEAGVPFADAKPQQQQQQQAAPTQEKKKFGFW